ncbi:hypothetical protein HYH03_018160 [Edaphochlamys debaryana]|uniref:SnoaL-like domain-containing protein n=1 Tax=Edaphochlamys debaryana TaxID=47281 RepID=A0A836BND8_9CHLO|nr:hypothetical protein HYH03_018160 [Edaphochlamys debaryana]|eukprot:KAG2482935.1 hypothetical protein HYH03_018160 [Edaphochlamys debaryana]
MPAALSSSALSPQQRAAAATSGGRPRPTARALPQRSRLLEVLRASATPPSSAQEGAAPKRREVLGALSLASAGSVLAGVAAPRQLLRSAGAAPDPAAALLDAYAKFGDFQASGDPAKYKARYGLGKGLLLAGRKRAAKRGAVAWRADAGWVLEATLTDDVIWTSNVNGGFDRRASEGDVDGTGGQAGSGGGGERGRSEPNRFNPRGKAEAARYFQYMRQYNDISTFEPFHQVVQGNEVVSFVNITGSGKSTGTPYASTLVHWVTVSPDGRIASSRELCDQGVMGPALGPAPFPQ